MSQSVLSSREVEDPISILNPSDGSPVGSMVIASTDEVHGAVTRARNACDSWRSTAPAERGRLLEAAAVKLEMHADRLAAINHRETGRPVDESGEGIAAGVETLRQYAQLGPLHRGRGLRGKCGALDYTVAEPRGVAALLTPWNDPVAIAAGLIGAALVTGNTVLHKPSERCPHLGAMLGQILEPVFPAGVFTTLIGSGRTGALLAAHADVDVIAHVGSTSAGNSISLAALDTGAHVIRENGGKDPLLVDSGVDPVWAAAQAAIGAFANSGQICTSVERIYVHREVADSFIVALTERAAALNRAGKVAPLVDRELRRVVATHVDDAVADGALCLEGGKIPDGPGAFYPATVLVNCTPDMTVMREETFGPVAPVMVVDSFDEGLTEACSGRYGLAATVLTGDFCAARQAVSSLPVGTVKINAVFGGAPGGAAQPRGDSGCGFGYGPELLDEFTEVKVIHWAPGGPGCD